MNGKYILRIDGQKVSEGTQSEMRMKVATMLDNGKNYISFAIGDVEYYKFKENIKEIVIEPERSIG